jgi:hypothetical protein
MRIPATRAAQDPPPHANDADVPVPFPSARPHPAVLDVRVRGTNFLCPRKLADLAPPSHAHDSTRDRALAVCAAGVPYAVQFKKTFQLGSFTLGHVTHNLLLWRTLEKDVFVLAIHRDAPPRWSSR